MIQIRNRCTGAVLYESETLTTRSCVQDAIKDGADLAGAILRGANLRGANLRGAYLAGANLADANLADANLADANLAGAYLAGATLADATLADATLADADLADADLRGAYLADANLAGANIRGANLAGANLRGVSCVILMGQPDGWRAWAYLRDGWMSVRVGCKDMRLHEARAYWCETHRRWPDRREVAAALDYAEAVAKLRGWAIEGPK